MDRVKALDKGKTGVNNKRRPGLPNASTKYGSVSRENEATASRQTHFAERTRATARHAAGKCSVLFTAS